MLTVCLDIGGAYTKIAVLRADGVNTEILNIGSDYFPFWRRKEQFPRYIRAHLPEEEKLIGVTMTAELADCFSSKGEGVKYILDSISPIARTLVLDASATCPR